MRGLWRLLQLADSAFPAGGFAHSGGLEAAAWLGEVRTEADVARFAAATVRQAACFALPFVRAARGSAGALDAAAQPSPIEELLGSLHDALPARMFQS